MLVKQKWQPRAKVSPRSTNTLLWFLAVLIVYAAVFAYPAYGFRGKYNSDSDQIVTTLKDKLKLSETQEDQLRPIIESHVTKRQELFNKYRSGDQQDRRSMRAEMQELRENTRSQLAKYLTDDQMVSFDRLQAEQKRKHGRQWKGQRDFRSCN